MAFSEEDSDIPSGGIPGRIPSLPNPAHDVEGASSHLWRELPGLGRVHGLLPGGAPAGVCVRSFCPALGWGRQVFEVAPWRAGPGLSLCLRVSGGSRGRRHGGGPAPLDRRLPHPAQSDWPSFPGPVNDQPDSAGMAGGVRLPAKGQSLRPLQRVQSGIDAGASDIPCFRGAFPGIAGPGLGMVGRLRVLCRPSRRVPASTNRPCRARRQEAQRSTTSVAADHDVVSPQRCRMRPPSWR